MEHSALTTEADVETQVVIPLLTDPALLGIPHATIQSKIYLAPTVLDKKSGKTHGYIPDFSVWVGALPLLIVEAKAPDVETAVGYREAGLYALHLNKQFRAGLNPCHVILATNGITLEVGYWDAAPSVTTTIDKIAPGTAKL